LRRLAWISHRVCPGSAGAALPGIYSGEGPKNGLHLRNVHYAERRDGRAGASEVAVRMGFVALRPCSASPRRLAKYFE